ncbi:hypothetical protein NOVO_05805 [Rickettsiales bacterium Ac37b]|nr:hypothetical protein NOVO_05805 [Rickettsiales bacterium Ac37b]
MSKLNSNLIKKILLIILCIILLSTIFFSYYILIFIIIGAMPSIIAIIIKNRLNIYSLNTVLAMNTLALLPFIFQLLNTYKIHEFSRVLVSNSDVWVMIYGIISVGILCIIFLPQLCGRISVMISKNRIIRLEQRKTHIMNSWDFNKKEN